MRYLYLLFILFIPGISAAQWTKQLEFDGEIHTMQFVDKDFGIITGTEANSVVIYRTFNQGKNWYKIYSKPEYRFMKARFADHDHGWALVYPHNSGTATLLRTESSGMSWTEQMKITNGNIYSIEALDGNRALLVGEHTIRLTEDGGKSWKTVLTDTTVILRSVQSISKNRKIAYSNTIAASNDNIPYYSQDAGKTWIKLDPVPLMSSNIFFLDNFTAYGILREHYFLRTSNGGSSWDTLSRSNYQLANVIHFSDAMNGWAVGSVFIRDPTINYTTNGGLIWAPDSSALALCNWPIGVWFENPNEGWIAGTHRLMHGSMEGSKGVVIHYNTLASGVEEKASADLVQVFASGNSVRIQANADGIFSLRVYDVMGNLHIADEGLSLSPGQILPLETSGLTDGVYFVSLQSGGSIVREKFTIIR